MADIIRIRIAELLKRSGRTQKQLANFCGVSAQAVNQWVNGSKNDKKPVIPTPANLVSIAEFFGVSVDYLHGKEPSGQPIDNSSIINIDMSSSAEIPLVPLNELMILNSEDSVGKEFSRGKKVHTARQWSSQARAFTMVDDSMEPKFSEGDIITIDPDQSYDPGECVAAFIRSLGITVFRQFSYDGPDHCTLSALNSHHRSYRFTHQEWKDDVVVIGPWVERIVVSRRSPKRHSS